MEAKVFRNSIDWKMKMFNELKGMCTPPGPGKAYYRPLLCKSHNGNIDKLPIFIVGINPATPIYPKQINDIQEYVDLIMDYEAFTEYYQATRKEAGKKPESKTRTAINQFVEWLFSMTQVSIAETNIVPYPTESLALLNKEPKEVFNGGTAIFYKLMMHYQPRVMILHGKTTAQMLTNLLIDNKLITNTKGNEFFNTVVKMDYSADSKLAEFIYPDGQACSIIAYRHFMSYGLKGPKSQLFMNRVEGLIKEVQAELN